MAKSTHITVNVDGVQKVLAHVFLQKDGSPTVKPVHGHQTRPYGASPENVGDVVTSRKTSLHLSARSDSHNTVKTETITSNGKKSFVQVTRAIKQTERMSLLFSYRFSDLRKEKHRSRVAKKRQFTLCDYDPSKWNLVVHFAWSKKGRKLNATTFKDWRYKKLEFDATELHMFFCFYITPALPIDYEVIFSTLDPTYFGDMTRHLEDGLGDTDLARIMLVYEGMLVAELATSLSNVGYEDNGKAFEANMKLLKVGRSRHMQFQDIQRNVNWNRNYFLDILDETAFDKKIESE